MAEEHPPSRRPPRASRRSATSRPTPAFGCDPAPSSSARWSFAVVVIYVRRAGVLSSATETHQAAIKQSPYPLAPAPSHAPCRAEPRLEQIDRLAGVETPNVYEREAAKLQTLNSYGPTAEEGFVHIPIERAMQLMVEQTDAAGRGPNRRPDQSNAIRRPGRCGRIRIPAACFKGGPQ